MNKGLLKNQTGPMNYMEENFVVLRVHLSEKARRLVAAAMVKDGSHGIKGGVSKATRSSYREIRRGTEELSLPLEKAAGTGGLRKKGGGRKGIAFRPPAGNGVAHDLRDMFLCWVRPP
jgi:hypothetical protein